MSTTATPYTFGTRLSIPLHEARPRVEAALKAEGFGVLTEIDVAATLKARLGVDRDPYVILGACNPPLAHRALEADPSIGALLPCNVVLRADGDDTLVEVMDPYVALTLARSPEIEQVGVDARERLQRVVEALRMSADRDLTTERAAISAWNERHAGGDFEGRGPNPTLMQALAHVTPGRALELGAGSGTNAAWLAKNGWQVTAVDWSAVALANARRQADEAGVTLDLQERNVFEWQPPEAAFDLVLLVYLHLPPPQRRLVYPVAARAVAPGGRMVVIGHDRSNAIPGQPSRPDPERLFTAAELADELTAADSGLVVERAEVVRQDPPPEHNPIDALLVLRRSAS